MLKQEEEERECLVKFRDRHLSGRLLQEVKSIGQELKERLGRRPVFIEVCGTHSVNFSQTGLRRALEETVDLRSGPGCPLCVTDQGDIDRIIELSTQENVVLGTLGNVLKVPGSRSSLEQERARGARALMFNSPSEAVRWAWRNPLKHIVFLGVGFEPTASVVALSILEAEDQGIKNYSVYSVHKRIIPALKTLLKDSELRVDGFILPGHVSVVVGRKPFDFLALDNEIPGVIAGYEPMDLLGAVENLTQQLLKKTCRVDNNYTRVVREEGNITAQRVIQEYFDPCEVSWRGLGKIPDSGLALKKELQVYNAAKRFPVEVSRPLNQSGCSCREVLTGKILPTQCDLFGRECIPSRPVGLCMASPEGACASYYQYDYR
ncbi:hydrogenase formation protein HypD [Candidatus Contubernalis alkalaceticus]|nr:hydrogenase formation protein HypD [Candidatus Contubernalis alkalaceticus]